MIVTTDYLLDLKSREIHSLTWSTDLGWEANSRTYRLEKLLKSSKERFDDYVLSLGGYREKGIIRIDYEKPMDLVWGDR